MLTFIFYFREGIFKVGDRIVAINGIETLQLSPRMFSNLKNKALAAREIELDVEIDVYDAKILFGTFDVVLEGKLRIGFIFDGITYFSILIFLHGFY